MALINLTLIGQLTLEAYSQKCICESYCYNVDDAPEPFTDQLFVSFIKTERQATNLFDLLKEIHTKCTDFSAGNFQAYMDRHYEFVDPEDSPFNAFHLLLWPFDGESITDLPKTIEQYAELCLMAQHYADVRKLRDLTMDRILGDAPRYYLEADEDGDQVMVPFDEVPQERKDAIDIKRELESVEVEYCLDGYNEFYGKCLEIIHAYEPSGLIKACADEILSLYAPYQAAHE